MHEAMPGVVVTCSTAILWRAELVPALRAINMASLKMAQDVCKHITSKQIELESPSWF